MEGEDIMLCAGNNYGVGVHDMEWVHSKKPYFICVCVCMRARTPAHFVCVLMCVHACLPSCVRSYMHTCVRI